MFFQLLVGTTKIKTHQSVNSQNYKTKKVTGEQIGSSEQCGSQLLE